MANKSVQITISGSDRDVDELLAALAYIDHCCMVGHSDSIKIDFDGDGAANIKCESNGERIIKLLDSKSEQFIKECIDNGDTPDFSIGY